MMDGRRSLNCRKKRRCWITASEVYHSTWTIRLAWLTCSRCYRDRLTGIRVN